MNDFWNYLISLNSGVYTVFVAIIALVLAIWQGYLSRKHNRLSVRPALAFDINIAWQNKGYSVSFINNGLGSALLSKIKVLHNNIEIGEVSKAETWTNVGKALNIKGIIIDYITVSENYPIKANETVELVTFTYSSILKQDDQIEELNKLNFIVKYNSFYNEEFHCAKEDNEYSKPSFLVGMSQKVKRLFK